MLAKGSKLFDPERSEATVAEGEKAALADAKRVFFEMRNAHRQLSSLMTDLQIGALAPPPPVLSVDRAVTLFEKVEGRRRDRTSRCW